MYNIVDTFFEEYDGVELKEAQAAYEIDANSAEVKAHNEDKSQTPPNFAH